MAIQATPISNEPAEVSCEAQRTLFADVTEIDGCARLGQQLSVVTRTGHAQLIDWTMRDRSGNPLDLTTCGVSFDDPACSSQSSESEGDFVGCGSIVFRMVESLSYGREGSKTLKAPDVSIKNAETGVITIKLNEGLTACPGIFLGELALLDPDDNPFFSNIFYIFIEASQFGTSSSFRGPPSLAEIRLHLRDNHPIDNLLLDRIDFDPSEIALAIQRPLDYWNDTPPPLNTRMTTSNFPYRWAWLEGIVANLFLMAEESYRRNDFQYSAAGISVADKRKFAEYDRAGSKRWAAYQQWVREKKVSININSAFGGIGSPYNYF